MSFYDGYRELAESEVFPWVKRIPAVTGLVFSGEFLELISDTRFDREILPEPFDFPSHVGNFREAAIATVGAFALFGMRKLVDKPREVFMRNARRVAVSAFLASSAIQVTGEQMGLTNDPLYHNTGDPLDAAYGVAWSAVVAVGMYKTTRGLEQEMHDRVVSRKPV